MVMDSILVVATGLWPVEAAPKRDRPQGGGYSKRASRPFYALDAICFVILTANSRAAVA